MIGRAAGAALAIVLAGCSSGSTTPATKPADLHHADLKNVSVPGSACLQSHPIQLRDGKARIADARGNPSPPSGTGARYVNLSEFGGVTFGDLESADVSDAAVSLTCDNNGGTADGVLLYSLAVFSGRTGHPVLLGLVTPRQQPAHELPTLFGDVNLSGGQLTVREFFYGPKDRTCCPTGRAETTWGYRNGALVVLSTKVTTKPA